MTSTPPEPTPAAPAPTPGPAPAPAPEPDLGFPKDTPVTDMSPVQQAAYWKDKARKHEGRSTEWQSVLGGKTAAEVQAELASLDTLRREQMTEQQKAVDDAAKAAREATAAEYAPKAARAVLELALSHVTDPAEKAEILDAIDLKSVVKDSGDIDTDKVSRLVQRLAPAGKDGERRLRDFGAGDRRADKTSGVAAGRDLFKERRGGKSTTTTSS